MYYRLMYEDMTDKQLLSFNPREQSVLKCMTLFHLNILNGSSRIGVEFSDPYRCLLRAKKILATGGRCAMYGCRRGSNGEYWHALIPISMFDRMREVDAPPLPPIEAGRLS